MNTLDNSAEPSLVKPVVGANSPSRLPIFIIAVVVVALLAGTGTGLLAYKKATAGTISLGGQDVQVVNTPTEEGVKDASTFKDTASGTLQVNDGKITDEGTHVLIREGGVSQNVYLTSSVVDMNKYVGKKVQVWGETFKGQKAGWLMDVGRIKVIQ